MLFCTGPMLSMPRTSLAVVSMCACELTELLSWSFRGSWAYCSHEPIAPCALLRSMVHRIWRLRSRGTPSGRLRVRL